jgi:hypothetical protein
MAHGGKREGAGRKRRDEEDFLVEKLSAYDNDAFAILIEGVMNKEYRFLKMFMEYRFGKPRETKEVSLVEDLPLFVD